MSGPVAVVVVNVVVYAWGASSEVFLRPLYAVKSSPATFATLEKNRVEPQEDIEIDSRLIRRQASSRVLEEPDEQAKLVPLAARQSRGVPIIPDLKQRWLAKEPRRVSNRRRDSEIDYKI